MEHLNVTTSVRGLDSMPPIVNEDGEEVRVWASSSAEGPHVWLKAADDYGLAKVHLSADDAWRLAEQLQALVRNHYQGDATPEWAR